MNPAWKKHGMEGFLEKMSQQSNVFNGWRKRYFKLERKFIPNGCSNTYAPLSAPPLPPDMVSEEYNDFSHSHQEFSREISALDSSNTSNFYAQRINRANDSSILENNRNISFNNPRPLPPRPHISSPSPIEPSQSYLSRPYSPSNPFIHTNNSKQQSYSSVPQSPPIPERTSRSSLISPVSPSPHTHNHNHSIPHSHSYMTPSQTSRMTQILTPQILTYTPTPVPPQPNYTKINKKMKSDPKPSTDGTYEWFLHYYPSDPSVKISKDPKDKVKEKEKHLNIPPSSSLPLSSLVFASQSKLTSLPHCFQLDFEDRSLLLNCNSHVELYAWLTGIIAAACEENTQSQTGFVVNSGGTMFMRAYNHSVEEEDRLFVSKDTFSMPPTGHWGICMGNMGLDVGVGVGVSVVNGNDSEVRSVSNRCDLQYDGSANMFYNSFDEDEYQFQQHQLQHQPQHQLQHHHEDRYRKPLSNEHLPHQHLHLPVPPPRPEFSTQFSSSGIKKASETSSNMSGTKTNNMFDTSSDNNANKTSKTNYLGTNTENRNGVLMDIEDHTLLEKRDNDNDIDSDSDNDSDSDSDSVSMSMNESESESEKNIKKSSNKSGREQGRGDELIMKKSNDLDKDKDRFREREKRDRKRNREQDREKDMEKEKEKRLAEDELSQLTLQIERLRLERESEEREKEKMAREKQRVEREVQEVEERKKREYVKYREVRERMKREREREKDKESKRERDKSHYRDDSQSDVQQLVNQTNLLTTKHADVKHRFATDYDDIPFAPSSIPHSFENKPFEKQYSENKPGERSFFENKLGEKHYSENTLREKPEKDRVREEKREKRERKRERNREREREKSEDQHLVDLSRSHNNSHLNSSTFDSSVVNSTFLTNSVIHNSTRLNSTSDFDNSGYHSGHNPTNHGFQMSSVDGVDNNNLRHNRESRERDMERVRDINRDKERNRDRERRKDREPDVSSSSIYNDVMVYSEELATARQERRQAKMKRKLREQREEMEREEKEEREEREERQKMEQREKTVKIENKEIGEVRNLRDLRNARYKDTAQFDMLKHGKSPRGKREEERERRKERDREGDDDDTHVKRRLVQTILESPKHPHET